MTNLGSTAAVRLLKWSFRSLLTRFGGLEGPQFEILPEKKKYWAFAMKSSPTTSKNTNFENFPKFFQFFFEFQNFFSFFF
jgi:hypothetical protein